MEEMKKELLLEKQQYPYFKTAIKATTVARTEVM